MIGIVETQNRKKSKIKGIVEEYMASSNIDKGSFVKLENDTVMQATHSDKIFGIAQTKAVDRQTVKVVRPKYLVPVVKTMANTDFKITNKTYKFDYDSENLQFKSSNKGISSSTAETALTLKEDYEEIHIDYSVSSEASYDKFTMKINNTIIANAISGIKSNTYTWKNAKVGDTITLQYVKDSSGDKNDDCVIVKITNKIYVLEEEN